MDLLRRHIDAGVRSRDLTDGDILLIAQSMDRDPVDAHDAREQLNSVFELIREAPQHLRPQLLAAKLLEKSRRRDDMLDTWAGLASRFPNCQHAKRLHLRWLGREKRHEDALNLVKEFDPGENANRATISAFSDLVFEIRDDTARDKLFADLLARDPGNIRVRVVYGKTLFARGHLKEALGVLDTLRERPLSPAGERLKAQNERALAALGAIGSDDSDETGQPAILRSALALFQRRKPRRLNRDRMGGIQFYTGGLGAGGAERQMTRIASLFHRHTISGRRVNGVWIDGPIEVIVNSVDPKQGKDFHRQSLDQANVPIHVTSDMHSAAPDLSGGLSVLDPLLPLLPRNAIYGVERLSHHFKERAPDVVYLWQDGAVLTGALAALIAGVPQIALSLRGLPPVMRPHLMKPAYLDLYRGLAEVPGISFSSNSRAAADAYADWTGIARSRFSVIHNAVTPFSDKATSQSARAFEVFDQKTKDAQFTLGGVFRFTPNKRGLVWVEWAARLLKRDPSWRFILVGAGEELHRAKWLARDLGLSDRLLFVGETNDVGYWLQKLDLLLLLSENEGLPNVLIEAQLAGVPVISTPAGGASETFAHDKTGFLLSSARTPDFTEFANFVSTLTAHPENLAQMSARAAALAGRSFNPDHALSQTLRMFYGEQVDSRDADASENIPKLEMQPQKRRFDKRVQEAYNLIAGSNSRF